MPTETQRPDGELSDVGLVANDYTDHDEDPDVSSVTINATGNNVNTEWGGDFPTPTGNPTVGTDLQEFRVGVEEFDSGQTGTPDARIELWENGSLVRAGSNTPVSTYAVLSFPWNASELATADGSLVQCKLIGVKSGGGPNARNTVRIGHMEWNVEYSTGPTTYFETLTAATVGTAGLSRTTTFTKTLAATVLGVAGLSTLTTWFRTLAATTVGAATLLKKTSKTLTTAALASATLAAAALIAQALTATASVVAGLNASGVIGQTLAATAVGVASLSTLTTWFRTLTATAIGVAGLLKKTSKTLVAVAQGSAGLAAATLYTKALAVVAVVAAGLTTAYTAAPVASGRVWRWCAIRLGI